MRGGGLPVLPPLLDISAPTPHDAMPAGDRLFVASTGSSQVTVFKLPISATGVTFSPITSAPGNVFGHSVYFDAAGGPGSLWVLSEAAATPSAPNIVNFERFAYSLNPVSSSPDAASSQALTYRIIPSGIVSPLSDIVHHIRGVGRTGFCANYNDGLSLLSLVPTGPGVQPVVLGSYDTSPRSRPVSGNAVQALVDKFDGTWDVFPGSPSGIVYASAGDLGVVAFKVTQGHINRYWNATPFPVGAAAEGLCPSIVSPYGPVRGGIPYVLEDETASRYPYKDAAGNPVTYRHTLYYSASDPVTPYYPWIPNVVTVVAGVTNTGEQNLDPASVAPPYTLAIGKSTFMFASLVASSTYYAQIVVEELVGGVPSGRWAASRGAWIGVAP